jgi:hypothetical protein
LQEQNVSEQHNSWTINQPQFADPHTARILEIMVNGPNQTWRNKVGC